MPACCVVYTVDQSYLFPTFVSAVQARRHSDPDKADVLILGFDLEPRVARDFASVCATEGIGMVALDRAAIDGQTPMMARLFLDRLLPGHYTQILYIDGDTQVVGSLDGLIATRVPDGQFLAANDPMTFTLAGTGAAGRAFAAHAQSIGLSARQARGYFNTGVLRINRVGWDATGQQALALILKNQRAFRFPDQDPLNVAGADRHLPMSLAWNFPIFMCNAALQADINPVIYHYMSKPKPWQGGFLPWRAPGAVPYAEAVARHPVLADYNPSFPPGARLRYHLQQRAKAVQETLTWRLSERRTRILQYEHALLQTAPA